MNADGFQEPEKHEELEARKIRICKVCGAKFSVIEENELCPACMLRRALGHGVEAEEPSLGGNAEPGPAGMAPRFEHYELVLDKDGRPLELGRARRQPPLAAPVRFQSGCFVGANVTILAGVTIGREAAVAAGSVVTADVPTRTLFGGVPARALRTY